jgi:hypothetical protein
MKYTIRKDEKYNKPYWKKEFKGKRVDYTSMFMYDTDDFDVFLDVIRDMIDACDYELTKQNIHKNFGDISDRSVKQIQDYYTFRNDVYQKIVEFVKLHNVEGTGPHFESWHIPYECDGSNPDVVQDLCKITVVVNA